MSTKLSPRNVFLIALALALVIIGMWYTFRFKPRQDRIGELSTELDSLNLQVTKLRSETSQVPALRQEVAKLRVDQAQFLAALPSTANFGTVLDEVRLTTAATGATMNSFAVQNGNVTGLPGGVRPIGVNIALSGKFSQLFQTLRALETMGRFTTISSLAMQLPAANSPDPTLEGTLGMTVYTFDPAQATAPSSGTPQAPNAPAAAPAAPSNDNSGGVR